MPRIIGITELIKGLKNRVIDTELQGVSDADSLMLDAGYSILGSMLVGVKRRYLVLENWRAGLLANS